jgi:CheY-like chemotaxis protein
MDGSMPELDGFEATRQIRAWDAAHHLAEMPIVALTAHVVGEKGDLWRDAGMSDFISKPFNLAMIEACLRRWAPERAMPSKMPEALGLQALECREASVAPLLDPEVLGSIREIQAPGDDLIGRIVDLYVENAPATLARFGADCSVNEVSEVAHALKSLSRNVGAIRVGNIADTIETNARNNGCEPSPAILTELTEALDATLVELQAIEGGTNAKAVA